MGSSITERLGRRVLSSFALERWKDFMGELESMRVHRQGVKAAGRFTWTPGARLNIGCGPVRSPGFVRVDFCPGVDIRVDLRRPLPIPDGIASVILCEHFLEHLRYPGQATGFLRECKRVLQPGGRLLLSVPDTYWPMECYIRGTDEWQQACKENNWHPKWVRTSMEHMNYHFRQQDDSRSDGHFECHRFAYDEETLAKVLRAAGFEQVSRRAFEPGMDAPHRELGSLFMLAVK